MKGNPRQTFVFVPDRPVQYNRQRRLTVHFLSRGKDEEVLTTFVPDSWDNEHIIRFESDGIAILRDGILSGIEDANTGEVIL